MPQENKNKNKKVQKPNEENLTNPSAINGKIEVKDTRERKDGPGGN